MGENKKIVETEKKEIDIYTKENIRNMIFETRGKQVILDSDVATLYHYETKYINLAVRRNKERFPEEFCFQLTEKEINCLRLQITTLSKNNNDMKFRSNKYLPYAFTEQGIAMLSGLLKNEIAVKVSINIMNTFVEMRKLISNNSNIFNRLSNMEYQMIEQGMSINKQSEIIEEHSKKFEEVFEQLQNNEKEVVNSKIFYDGQIYDAYILIIKLIKETKEKILIIDNYIDDSMLEMLAKKNKNVAVTILTSSNNKSLTKLDVEKFNKQYPTLMIGRTSKFHDRFIVIDEDKIYHIGASLKDLGKKCFAINKMEDSKFLNKLKT